jgi:hypothetical protein
MHYRPAGRRRAPHPHPSRALARASSESLPSGLLLPCLHPFDVARVQAFAPSQALHSAVCGRLFGAAGEKGYVYQVTQRGTQTPKLHTQSAGPKTKKRGPNTRAHCAVSACSDSPSPKKEKKSTEQEVATSALCECGSGAPQMRAPRGPCLCNPPGKKKSHRVGGGGCARALAMYKPSKKNIAAACFFCYTVHYR